MENRRSIARQTSSLLHYVWGIVHKLSRDSSQVPYFTGVKAISILAKKKSKTNNNVNISTLQ